MNRKAATTIAAAMLAVPLLASPASAADGVLCANNKDNNIQYAPSGDCTADINKNWHPIHPAGSPGKDGADGKNGENGVDGKDSQVPGPAGAAGTPGDDGVPGAPGAPGADGADGAPGERGADGVGVTGPAGQDGIGISNITGQRIPSGGAACSGAGGMDIFVTYDNEIESVVKVGSVCNGVDGKAGLNGAPGPIGLAGTNKTVIVTKDASGNTNTEVVDALPKTGGEADVAGWLILAGVGLVVVGGATSIAMMRRG